MSRPRLRRLNSRTRHFRSCHSEGWQTSGEAASELSRCASKVERVCGRPTEDPVKALRIEWMRRLGNGERVVDIAASAGRVMKPGPPGPQ